MDKIDILSMTLAELEDFTLNLKLPKFRAKQIYKWLHKELCTSFDEMTDLPLELRSLLKEKCFITSLKTEKKLVSKIDGTVKYLFKLSDGNFIETVLMEYNHWFTVCASTQVGCRMGCKFCASGLNGLVRNLTPSEILSQVIFAQKDMGVRVSHVVLMGIGEPLDNFNNTVKFLLLVTSEQGLNLSPRHISLSTSGIVPNIYKLSEYNFPLTLSVSLHNPINEERSKIMPVNKSYSVDKLIKSCKDYIKATGRRISFEYALIDGVNNSDFHAKKLAELLKGMQCHVNLIPANPVAENNFTRPDNKKIIAFKNKLESLGLNATVRRTLGADINASCGQLRRENS